jgi:hypothetical protein
MGYGVGQGVRPTHPGEPLPPWGRFGRPGCIVFVAVLTAIMTIAFLIGMTKPSGEAVPTASFGETVPDTIRSTARPSGR